RPSAVAARAAAAPAREAGPRAARPDVERSRARRTRERAGGGAARGVGDADARHPTPRIVAEPGPRDRGGRTPLRSRTIGAGARPARPLPGATSPAGPDADVVALRAAATADVQAIGSGAASRRPRRSLRLPRTPRESGPRPRCRER